MIPIECPRCGRTGNVPPDRLNARLVCKGCQSAFHMDNGGRMVLGEPGNAKSKKSNYGSRSSAVDIDFAQTWRELPKPAKYGVPAAVFVLAGWMLFPSLSSGLAYQDQAEAVGRAVLSGDRAQVIAMATPASAEAAGKWYDLVHAPIAGKSSTGGSAEASLFEGTPDKGGGATMSVVVTTADAATTNFIIQMVKDDGQWRMDGDGSCSHAERAATPVKLAKKR